MKKIIRLTESELIRVIKNVVNEQNDCEKNLFSQLNNWRLSKMFKDSIDKIIKPHANKWENFNDRKKYENILKLIGKSESEINSILDISFVYDQFGNWDRINKLNTNYSDTAKFIIDIFKDQGKNLCDVHQRLLSDNKSDLKELILHIDSDPDFYWKKYLENNTSQYTKNNERNSLTGNDSENYVVEFLLGMNWKLIYQSKEGSPIDTKLGIDIIMKSPENKIAKIQVKTVGTIKPIDFTPCDKNLDVQLKHKQKKGGYQIYTNSGIVIRDKEINLVAYVTTNGKILILRKYSPVTILNNKCLDQPNFQFPSSPKKGYFFVDHESVVFYRN